MPPPTIDDLRKVIALSDLPDEHLRWIFERSEYQEFSDGTVMSKYGDEADSMYMIVEGKLTFYMYINGRQVYYLTFENDAASGGITGLLPYSRMKTMPGYAYALGDVKGFRLHKKYFGELEQLNPALIQRLVGYMTERARTFATLQLQQEKVSALGNLAAGIAHELNNPAAAINRISHELNKRLNRNYELTKQLLQSSMKQEHIDHIYAIVEKKESDSEPKIKRTALQQVEYEDELTEWFGKNGVPEKALAETFSELGFSIAELEQILHDIGKDTFILALPWLENLLGSFKIIKDLDAASNHISTLVGSIKSHVHMDRTNELLPTDIHQDIENTLTLLGFKLRKKNINVVKKFCDGMPKVAAYVGELNQVWTNLIDNAIFALPEQGELTIETKCTSKEITVCVIDNGAGIPKEILSRIFEPFFTTKKVGEGTGIGLDLVSRIVKRHNGEIKVKSVPGKTEFSVCIPIEQKKELQ
jgi:signal transduction histidine kinase